MYTTKKTAPEKNSPFNLHEQDQGEWREATQMCPM